jgi:hypothetical protein
MALSLHHKASLAALLCAVAIVPACSSTGGEGASSGDPSGGNTSGGNTAGLDEYLTQNGILKLADDGTGVERGKGTSSAEGVIAFYSPAKNGVIRFSLGAMDVPAIAGLEVHVSAGADAATYYIVDPAGMYAPLLFSAPYPQGDVTQTVDAAKIFEEGGLYEFDDKAPSPFPLQTFSVGELNFTMNMQTLMQGIASQVALLALKTVVSSTCSFFAPLHKDLCDKIGTYVGYAVSAYQIAVKVTLESGFQVLEIAKKVTVDVAVPELLDAYVCKPIGQKIFVTYFHPGAAAPVEADFRAAAFKLNYMLHKLDTDPPANKAVVMEELGRTAAVLSNIGALVRSNYLQIYNPESFQSFVYDASFSTLTGLVQSLITEGEISGIDQVDPAIQKLLVPLAGQQKLVIKDYKFKTSTPFNKVLGCVTTVISEVVVGEVNGMGAANDLEVSMENAVGGMIGVVDAKLNAIWAKGWGGAPPVDPTCLPDLFEPNDNWQWAVQSPIGGEISSGSGPVTIDKLNMCDASGKGGVGDADWFAFPVGGPFQFQVQARIMKPMEGKNPDKKVCVEVYWYSEAYEISGWDPDKIAGPACGPVQDQLATQQVNVGKTLGEAWANVLVKVYPDPSEGAALPEVDYTLLVKP